MRTLNPMQQEEGMATKPRLLFISPVFPDNTGYGLAMRAGALLEGLAATCQVSLLMVPLYDPNRTTLEPSLGRHCHHYHVVPIPRWRRLIVRMLGLTAYMSTRPPLPHEWHFSSSAAVRQAAQAFAHVHFDYVYVFRLYMIPFARAYCRRKSVHGRFVDLDDIESVTRRRLAVLYRRNGLSTQARRADQEAAIYATWERQMLGMFDRITICSQQDQTRLHQITGQQNIEIIPNVVRLPKEVPSLTTTTSFTFLFVGNLAYYPNEDALAFFITQVLPHLRAQTRQPWGLTVVGPGQPARLRKFRHIPECRFVGFVNDVTPYYHQADAVIVPLRAGGGTRIKVLEAFSFKRPVVSTTIGVEGLAVAHDTHVLIADEPQAFATQCYRLMTDPHLSARLTAKAFAWLVGNHTHDILGQKLARMISRYPASHADAELALNPRE